MKSRIASSGPFPGGGSLIGLLSLSSAATVGLTAGVATTVNQGTLAVQPGDEIYVANACAEVSMTVGATLCHHRLTAIENDGTTITDLGLAVHNNPGFTAATAIPGFGAKYTVLQEGTLTLRQVLTCLADAGAAQPYGTGVTFIHYRP